jgi:hypothetical protein
MPSDERDRQFERALQRHLRRGAGDEACLDAETLAAYHERTLSPEEMTQWKEHIVACTRCQETLALLEETNLVALHEWEEKNAVAPAVFMGGAKELRSVVSRMRGEMMDESALLETAASPTQAAAANVGRPRSTWRWIVPVGALAAGLIVFVAVREKKLDMATAPVQVAENRDAAAPMSAVESKQAEELSKSAQDRKERNLPANQKKDTFAPRSEAGAKASRAVPNDEEVAALVRKEAEMKRESVNELRADSSKAGEASPAPLPTPRAGAAGGAARAQGQFAAPKSAAPTREPARASDTAMLSANGAAADAGIIAAHAGDYTAVGNTSVGNRSIIKAPEEKALWRVGPAGKIEMSIDLGKTWVPQNSGVRSDLITGSAPSEKVCWVVGKAGTMLMTGDAGAHWKQIVSPITGDLGGISASDAQHATVWAGTDSKAIAKMKTVSGPRGFTTTNGGESWTPVDE